MVSEITRFYCKPDMTSSWFLRLGALQMIVQDAFWRASMTCWLCSIVTFYLWCMVSVITRFYCKPDMMSLWFLRYGAFQAIFRDGFWKSDHDFLIALYTNFLSMMHGFRDNEVLLPTGNDVIVISPLGGVSHRFCWRNLTERPRFHNHGSLTNYYYYYRY